MKDESDAAEQAFDEFETAILRFGIVDACHFFGYAPNSEFIDEVIDLLRQRYNAKVARRMSQQEG